MQVEQSAFIAELSLTHPLVRVIHFQNLTAAVPDLYQVSTLPPFRFYALRRPPALARRLVSVSGSSGRINSAQPLGPNSGCSA